ncbi:hypothetical protein GLYMA_12G151800v4 [Glycine max]|uniref:Uncharacterized protein n=1 Tax=Glycine max TaxID=3847 RepID=A0A0R0HG17_SOYBN|nr:hypothetical protein GYH30_033824 [Glycine max]KRH26091.1 hypothetical protein GLYMA_12G151800v4 [Glycine max]
MRSLSSHARSVTSPPLRRRLSTPHAASVAAETGAGGPRTRRDQEAAGCSAPGVVDAEPCDGGDRVLHLPQRVRQRREAEGFLTIVSIASASTKKKRGLRQRRRRTERRSIWPE